MNEKEISVVEEKIARIKRGSYWFGIFGRVLIFIGLITLVTSSYSIVQFGFNEDQTDMTKIFFSNFATALGWLFNGWMCLLARDSFDSIDYLFQNDKDTV
ncbi:hypothetical protein MJH12_11620 [bacterium]|nr:hypothetical protein [bacterium]